VTDAYTALKRIADSKFRSGNREEHNQMCRQIFMKNTDRRSVGNIILKNEVCVLNFQLGRRLPP
jgi:hypothetical protein